MPKINCSLLEGLKCKEMYHVKRNYTRRKKIQKSTNIGWSVKNFSVPKRDPSFENVTGEN